MNFLTVMSRGSHKRIKQKKKSNQSINQSTKNIAPLPPFRSTPCFFFFFFFFFASSFCILSNNCHRLFSPPFHRKEEKGTRHNTTQHNSYQHNTPTKGLTVTTARALCLLSPSPLSLDCTATLSKRSTDHIVEPEIDKGIEREKERNPKSSLGSGDPSHQKVFRRRRRTTTTTTKAISELLETKKDSQRHKLI